jgi:methyl-accepting chemotaxis protein
MSVSKKAAVSKSRSRRRGEAAGTEALALQVPVALTQRLATIRLNTADSARDEVRALGLQRAQVAPSVANLFQSSQVRALNFTRGVIANWRDEVEAEQESEPLMQWARQSGPAERQMLARAFRLQGKGALVIHNIGGMAQPDAESFMKDYFEAGGDMDDVAEWFQRAGHALRTERAQAPGVEFFGKVVDWFKGAVKTVGDALKAAGKSLGDAIGKVINWTADKVADFVEGLIAAGRKVAEIMTEALKKGVAAARKFARAVLDAGRSLVEVMIWAGQQVATTVKEIVDEVLKTGRRVAQILSAVANQVASIVHATVRALVQLGRQVREIVDSVVNLAASAVEQIFKGLQLVGRKLAEVATEIARYTGQALKRLVEGAYKAFRQAADILIAFMKDQLGTLRMVLEGLLAAGLQLGQAVVDIVTHVAQEFRKGFFEGLIALGKSPFLIMKAALETAGGVAALALATLLDVLGGHRAMTEEEKRQARRVFGDAIDLDRVKIAVASIPADLINLVNGGRPFTTMYVINFSSKEKIDMKTLIHELAHVWQGVVAGPVYMIQAIEAQLGSEGYSVTDAMLQDRGNELKKFNREQQAVIAEEFWFEEFGQHEAAYKDLPSDGLDVDLLRPYAQQFKTGAVIRLPTIPKLPVRPLPTIPKVKLPRLSPIRNPSIEAARTVRRPSSRRKGHGRAARRGAR